MECSHRGLLLLYKDEHIIVVQKPPNMLSVPGRELRHEGALSNPRDVQWAEAIKSLLRRYERRTVEEKPILSSILQFLSKHGRAVPRQKEKFLNYVSRQKICKEALGLITIDDLVRLWDNLNAIDQELHSFDTSSLPVNLVSAADHIECAMKSEQRSRTGDSVVSTDSQKCTKIHTVHRLDQETSGLLIFALTMFSAGDLCKQFRNREVTKEYIAIVHGKFADSSELTGCIDAPLTADPDPANKLKQIVSYTIGKPAKTKYTVISDPCIISRNIDKLFPPIDVESAPIKARLLMYIEEGSVSMVRLSPVTGRTHQLRVHMAHVGHPILGDSLYSSSSSTGSDGFPRLCLHADKIQITHPLTRLAVSIESIVAGSAIIQTDNFKTEV